MSGYAAIVIVIYVAWPGAGLPVGSNWPRPRTALSAGLRLVTQGTPMRQRGTVIVKSINSLACSGMANQRQRIRIARGNWAAASSPLLSLATS